MICRSCGTEIADRAIVCYRCGTPTATPEPRAPARPGARRSRGVLAAVLILVLLALAAVLLLR